MKMFVGNIKLDRISPVIRTLSCHSCSQPYKEKASSLPLIHTLICDHFKWEEKQNKSLNWTIKCRAIFIK